MTSVFYSEFLIHPAPIEYSGNACTHNCAYCFSNIRCPVRHSDVAQTVRIFSGKTKSKSLLKFLVDEKYPVCMCNRSDPFSKSNIVDTKAVLSVVNHIENGIFFQTKGGDREDEAIEIIRDRKNVVMYITMTTIRDEISRRIEPGAPLPSQRIKLAEKAKGLGWTVIIAVNPCLESWMPQSDLEWLESKMEKIGVRHFIFQKLKLNSVDVKGFSDFRRKCFTDEELKIALTGKDAYFQTQVERQISKGLYPLAFGMPYGTDFFDEVNKTLGRAMNGNYAFFNSCFSSGREFFWFEDYLNSIIGENVDLLEYCGSDAQKYILGQHRGVWKDSYSAKEAKTFKDVLRIFWNNKRMPGSPQNNFLFQRVTDEKDDNGNILLRFGGGEILRNQRETERG